MADTRMTLMELEDSMTVETEADFDRLMDAMQTLIQLKPGDVLTQEMINDLHLVDRHNREDQERATDAFSRGYDAGLARAAGADTAKLIEERDNARDEAAIARGLRDVFRDPEAVEALVAHNDAMRSAYQVAARAGERTDWFALTDQLNAVLKKHHDITNKARDALRARAQ